MRSNGRGLPVAVVLSGGEVSDIKGCGPVMAEPGPQPSVVLADKRYDADAILADLKSKDIAAVIPPTRNRKVQPIINGHIYALRNLLERCFSALKHSRRLATQYDKTADSYLAFVLVASIHLCVRHFVTEYTGRFWSVGSIGGTIGAGVVSGVFGGSAIANWPDDHLAFWLQDSRLSNGVNWSLGCMFEA